MKRFGPENSSPSDLDVGVRKNALTAPITSVMSGPDGDYVYTISADNLAHRVPVLVAARQNGLAVLTRAPRRASGWWSMGSTISPTA